MNKPLYICFTGPTCSGKTTLSRQLADILSVNYNVCYINEVARDVLPKYQMSLDDLIQHTDLYYQFQCDVLESFLEREQKALEGDYDIIISDRSVHDSFVFALMLLPNDLYEQFKMQFKFVQKRYDLLVYCEHIEFKPDEFRSTTQYELGEVGLFQTLIKPHAHIVLQPEPNWKRLRRLLSYIEPKLE